jgi:hypothetical protein
MTKYTIVWDTELERAVAHWWLVGDSSMRSILTAIADWVDAYLTEDADVKGRAVPMEAARTITVPTSIATAYVDVTFEVVPEDRLVRVKRFVFRST